MNRQQRRHPTHPALPLPSSSNEKVFIENIRGKPDVKGYNSKGQKNKKRDG